MKRSRLKIWSVWLLLGALLLTACQSDVLPEELEGGDKAVVDHTDSCYINLHIVNNRATMTRATEVATAKENAVYDGILCIFEGENESTATLRSAVVIDQLINNPGNSSSVNITQRLCRILTKLNSRLILPMLYATGLSATVVKLTSRELNLVTKQLTFIQ